MVHGRAAGRQVEIVPTRIDKQLCGRSDERIGIVAQRLPLGQADHRAVVGGEAAYHHVVIRLEDSRGAARQVDAATRGMVRVDDVIGDLVVDAGRVGDQNAPAPIRWHQDGVVQQAVVLRADRAILVKDGDAGGKVIIQQVVAQQGIGHAVHVDRRAAAAIPVNPAAVIIDDIVLHQPVRHDAIPAHAGVTIHVQAAVGVIVQPVAAHGEVIAAVVNVDAVLAVVVTFVALDQHVIGEGRKDAGAPTGQAVIVDNVPDDVDVVAPDAVVAANINARAGRICHLQPGDHPV